MMRLGFHPPEEKQFRILCLGCHSDDIEIGCGGTILRLAEQYPTCVFDWVVFSGGTVREEEARLAASLFVPDRIRNLIIRNFRDGFMPFVGAEIKEVFEQLKDYDPHLVFTHNRRDAHQDHRLIAELTGNTFRNHCILEYEIPKYDGDLGQPGVFVPLSSSLCKKKISNILSAFQSQTNKVWFEETTFLSLMRLRGMECNSSSGYAEAFYCRKLVL